MRRANEPRLTPSRRRAAWLLAVSPLLLAPAQAAHPSPAATCAKPIYLTLDTGHMGVAKLMGDVMRRQGVKATFFVADERAQSGASSLSDEWGGWWRQMAADGHDFASHTHDHVYWRGDLTLPSGEPGFAMRPSAGPREGQVLQWTASDYCAELRRASDRIGQLSGKAPLPLFRAPGGKTSPLLMAAAKQCGYAHVGWAAAGFLGDELSSKTHPNAQLLSKALRDVRPGDILMAHLGIWSRQDPWAPAVFEPLIQGLKDKGFCFAPLREHPQYRGWIAAAGQGAR